MIIRVAGAVIVLGVLIIGGLIAYGYSLSADPRPVTSEIPDEQLPQ